MFCTSGQDNFVVTFATISRASIAVHLTEQKLLRQLQVTFHTADAVVLPQTREQSLRWIYVQVMAVLKSGDLSFVLGSRLHSSLGSLALHTQWTEQLVAEQAIGQFSPEEVA